MTDTTEIVAQGAPANSKLQYLTNAGKGRKRGVPNRVTRDVRAMVRYLTEARSEEFLKWIDRVAEDAPARACDIYLRLIETYVPRPSQGWEIEAGQATNALGQTTVAMRLRSLLEAPIT